MGRHFGAGEFDRAYRSFAQMYQVAPTAVFCSPDVLERFSEIFGRAGDAHVRELLYEGARVCAAVLAPGTVAFEGEVDAGRMGDW